MKPRVTARYELDPTENWGFSTPSIEFVIEFDHNETDRALKEALWAYNDIVKQIERSRPAKENR